MGGQALAEPNPPSIRGIRKGGRDPDLTQHYRGAFPSYTRPRTQRVFLTHDKH